MTDSSQIEISEARLDEKPIIGNLMELYQYDFTQFATGEHLDETGRFGFDRLDSYWIEPHRHPFILRVDGHPAGLALIREHVDLGDGKGEVNDVTEFFVMRAYRRSGVGEKFARFVWGRFPGRWQVREIEANTPAQAFWRAIIGRYTNGNYTEVQRDDEQWRGPIQYFDNSRKAGGG